MANIRNTDSGAWITNDGYVIHPDAPAGSGGQGYFRSPGPLGQNILPSNPVPHPKSPVGRYLALDGDITTTIQQQAAPATAPDDATLNEKIAQAAEEYVGKPVVGDGSCWFLLEEILDQSGAMDSNDFTKLPKNKNFKRAFKNEDYQWGTEVDINRVKRGDVLQFRNYIITVTTKTTHRGGSSESLTETYPRPHHSAVVLSVNSDGTLTIAEQHVLDRHHPHTDRKTGEVTYSESKHVMQNILYPPRWTKVTTTGAMTTEVSAEVSGRVWAYRPMPKPVSPVKKGKH